MLVLDANILIRFVLGRQVRSIIEAYAAKGQLFCTPDVAFADAQTYLPRILQRRSRTELDVERALGYAKTFIEAIDQDLYSPKEEEARLRLRGRDEDDWPILA